MYSLIVVDYNTIEKTIEYIKQCYKQIIDGESLNVVIVDNGSRNNSLEILSDEFGYFEISKINIQEKEVCSYINKENNIVYCQIGENLGYAKGNNLGAEISEIIFHDKYYIISNNDLILPNLVDLNKVTKLFCKYKNVGIIGPKIVGLNGQAQSPRKKQGAFTKLIEFYWAMTLGGPLRKCINDIESNKTSRICDWVMGCFMFVRADVFQRVGGFDPNTFLYAEELIISEKFNKVGYCTYFCNSIEIIHNHGETVKNSMSILQGAEISFESNYYYYKKYCDTSDIILYLAKINFLLYKKIYKIKQLIKRVIKSNYRRKRL